MLEYGAKLGGTELHWAAKTGDVELAALLLRFGADVNASLPSEHNRKPLHMAAHHDLYDDDTNDVAKLLLTRGADLYAEDDNGQTAMELAALCNNIGVAKLLLSYGVVPCDELLVAAAREDAADLIRLCIEHGCNVNVRNGEKATALHYTVRNGNVSFTEELMALQADVNAADADGNTPLHYAAQHAVKCDFADWEFDNLYDKRAAAAWRLLDSDKLLLNVRNDDRETPMNIAIRRGCDRMTEFLRSSGARADRNDIDFLRSHLHLEWFNSLN